MRDGGDSDEENEKPQPINRHEDLRNKLGNHRRGAPSGTGSPSGGTAPLSATGPSRTRMNVENNSRELQHGRGRGTFPQSQANPSRPGLRSSQEVGARYMYNQILMSDV